MLLTSMHVAMLFVVNPKKLLTKIAVRTVDIACLKYYFKDKCSSSAGTYANYSIFIFQKSSIILYTIRMDKNEYG